MKENKYDSVCILFLCASAPLFYMLLFLNDYSPECIILLCISLFFWLLISGQKNFECNAVISTLVTVTYLVLIYVSRIVDYPFAYPLFTISFIFLFLLNFSFFCY